MFLAWLLMGAPLPLLCLGQDALLPSSPSCCSAQCPDTLSPRQTFNQPCDSDSDSSTGATVDAPWSTSPSSTPQLEGSPIVLDSSQLHLPRASSLNLPAIAIAFASLAILLFGIVLHLSSPSTSAVALTATTDQDNVELWFIT